MTAELHSTSLNVVRQDVRETLSFLSLDLAQWLGMQNMTHSLRLITLIMCTFMEDLRR